MDADASESEASIAPTSPNHSGAGDKELLEEVDTADIFGDGSNVADSEATPVAEPGHAEQAVDPFRCEPCDARVPTMLPSPIRPSKEDVEARSEERRVGKE